MPFLTTCEISAIYLNCLVTEEVIQILLHHECLSIKMDTRWKSGKHFDSIYIRVYKYCDAYTYQ